MENSGLKHAPRIKLEGPDGRAPSYEPRDKYCTWLELDLKQGCTVYHAAVMARAVSYSCPDRRAPVKPGIGILKLGAESISVLDNEFEQTPVCQPRYIGRPLCTVEGGTALFCCTYNKKAQSPCSY
jgi:hypothetical protein